MIERPAHSVETLPYAPPATLYGRDQHLDNLRTLLSSVGAVLLHGTPGIGRRAVASTIAAEYVERSGGVLWFSVYHDDVYMLANRVARAYGVSALAADDFATQNDMAQALLQQNHPLVVLEGPIASGIVGQFLQHCLPSNAPLIFISNIGSEGPWARLELGPLADNDAVRVYREHGQLDEARRTALIYPLVNYVEGHPLALVVAGRQSATAGVSSTHMASLVPSAPSGPENRAMGVLAVAHSLLDSAGQGLFLLMGALFVDRVGLPLLSTISGVPQQVLGKIIGTLIERGLVDQIPCEDQPPMYRMHDLARVYARRRLHTAGQLDATRDRILRGVLRFVEDNTQSPSMEAYDALSREMDHILGLARHAVSTRHTEILQAIFKRLGRHGTQNVVHARGYYALYDRLGRLMTGKRPATESQVPVEPVPAPPDSVTVRLDTHQLTGMSREALQEALDTATVAQDTIAVARLTRALGDWYARHHKYEQALANFEDAVTHYENLDDANGLAFVLEKLAATLLKLDLPDDAIPQIQRGLALVDDDDHRRGQFIILRGDARMAQGHAEAALEAYQQGIDLLEDEDVAAGLALGKMATIHLDRSELQEASVVLAQAASLFERAGRRDLQGQALGNLGTAFGRMGRWREAGQRHMLALQIAREVEDVDEERYQLGNLAFVAEAEGHINWAIHYGRQALYLTLLASDEIGVAQLTLDLGRLLLSDSDQLPQAVCLLEASVEFAEQDEATRLLSRARKRLERLEESGYDLPPPETNLQAYAQAAYEMRQ